MEENENKEVVEETTQPVEETTETTETKEVDSPVSINEDGDIKLADTEMLNAEVSGSTSVGDSVLHDDEIKKYIEE